MLKILLAEDNPINVQLAILSLRKIADLVDSAANGEEAVSKFEKGSYDVILMDVQMPKVDGCEAARRIRTIEKNRNAVNPIPIIALTANSAKSELEQCFEAGMVASLSKPINIQAVQDLISSLLK